MKSVCVRVGAAIAAALLMIVGDASAQVTLRTQQVASGLNQPVGVYYAPGDTSRLFIIEQVGRIRVLNLTTTPPTLLATAFLDIGDSATPLTAANGERGLLGMAFDPNYSSNGFFYVNYTRASDGHTVIARFRANAPYATSNTADESSQLVFQLSASYPAGVSYTQDFANHNGGSMAFGQDGMLYIGAGDGGDANDPNERAQNMDTLLGKLIRLDVNDLDSSDGDGPYVPNDNPFRGSPIGVSDIRDKIWALGMRNPWRLNFDRLTGDLWIGDVGQGSQEEVDFQPKLVIGAGGNYPQVAGRNYGWDCREGLIATPASDVGCNAAAVGVYTDPIKVYTHSAPDNACSITGGTVYRGAAIPALQGSFFCADYCGQWVKSFRYDGTAVSDERDWTSQLNIGTAAVNGIVAVNDDASGELYIVSINLGKVYKIVPFVSQCGDACPAPANQLATLFFDDFETDKFWTASRGAGATDGDWQRGIPVTTANGYLYNPPFASGGSGRCYVTDNTDPASGQSTSDVDNGAVLLTSPQLDFTRGQITICFDYYLALNEVGGSNPDGLFADVSSNGTSGPWLRVASITQPGAGCVWTTYTITQAALTAAGVSNTSNMRVRFSASDNASPSQTIVEAGIDNFRVQTGNPPADCNNNGVADTTDIANGTSTDCNLNGIPDECDITASIAAAASAGNENLKIDLDGGPVGRRVEGSNLFNTSCVGCHAPNGTGATGPNIRNKDRVTIKNRLTLTVFHPGGGFPGFHLQEFADLEAFLADGGSKGRPDGIIDSCQTLSDCNNNGVSDGRELQIGTQADSDYDGTPDVCECRCDINGGGISVQDIFDFLALWFASSQAADFNGVGGVTVQDIFDFLSCWFAGC